MRGPRGRWRLRWGVLPALVLFALLFAALYLLGVATERSELGDAARVGNLYEWMVLINTIGLLALTVLIGGHLLRLLGQYRRGEPGSRLHLRLVVMVVVLTVLPLAIVYGFSLQFLQRGIDSWFKVQIEQALDDALELSRASLDLRKREWLRETRELAAALSEVSDEEAPVALNDLRAASGAAELTLLGKGRIIAISSQNTSTEVVPRRSGDEVTMALRQGRPYIGLEPRPGAGLVGRVVVALPPGGAEAEARLLEALYPLPQRLNDLAESVQAHANQYRALAFQREPLKRNFSLTLTLVLLLSLLAAVYAAFFTARRLLAPIRELAEGTRAVAAGDYSTRVRVVGADELGFLVRSFNEMTRRVGRASAEARRSREQAEAQRAYLQAVLANLSSGVITLDPDHRLRTVNNAAAEILGIPLQEHIGDSLVQLGARHPHLRRFVETVSPLLDRPERSWSEEIILFSHGGRQVLMCRGTTLAREEGLPGDHILVFDDVTTLVQAQRDAAWGEVARRLAHEIKNPLTPIQLSAERLRRKYLKSMRAEEAEVLERSTHTIVQQVEAMKEMVNAFSEYARAPQMQVEAVVLNDLIRDVLVLYPGLDAHLELDPRGPRIQADPNRLRQLLHNLLKNALEAMEGQDTRRVDLKTRCMDERGCSFVELELRDYGPGFASEALAEFFEPYVTTKSRGTGLGLAIVKKIAEEHGGMVWAENAGPGARIRIRLPVTAVRERRQETA